MFRILAFAFFLAQASPALADAQQRTSVTTRERELRGIMDRVQRAVLAQDTTTLKRFWATDFTFTAPSGALMNRAQRLEAVMQPDATPLDLPDMFPLVESRLHVVGAVAVMRSRHSRERARATRTVVGDIRILTVWERRRGSWLIVAQQATRVTADGVDATGARTRAP